MDKNILPVFRQLKTYISMFMLSIVVVVIAHNGMPYLNKFYSMKEWGIFFEYGGYICWGTALAEGKSKHLEGHLISEMIYKKLPVILSMLGIFFFVASEALSSAG